MDGRLALEQVDDQQGQQQRKPEKGALGGLQRQVAAEPEHAGEHEAEQAESQHEYQNDGQQPELPLLLLQHVEAHSRR